MFREGFTVQHRAVGRAAAWAAFFLEQVYAVVALCGFLSLKSPEDPIGDPFLSIMALLIILITPFMVANMVAVHAYASPEFKIYSLTALAFMIIVAGLTSSVNFAVLMVSRQVEAAGSPWLPLFLPYKWPAVAYALDIFAWGWFFALSMLFAAPIFREGRLEKTVCILMIVSGSLSLVGLISLPLSAMQAIRIGIVGWGVAGPLVFLVLAVVFGRTQPAPGESICKVYT